MNTKYCHSAGIAQPNHSYTIGLTIKNQTDDGPEFCPHWNIRTHRRSRQQRRRHRHRRRPQSRRRQWPGACASETGSSTRICPRCWSSPSSVWRRIRGSSPKAIRSRAILYCDRASGCRPRYVIGEPRSVYVGFNSWCLTRLFISTTATRPQLID